MNRVIIALGAVLLIASAIVIACAVFVRFPRAGCHWGWVSTYGPPLQSPHSGYLCSEPAGSFSVFPTIPRTSEPCLSYGVLLAVVALITMTIDYFIPKSTTRSGMVHPTSPDTGQRALG